MVIIGNDSATLLELTVCGDSPQAMLQAQARKGGKEDYLILASHLEDIGLETSFYTIEISSLGHTNSDTINALKSIYNVIESTASTTSLVNQLLKNSAKISVACSQTIFYARKNTLWEDRPLFKLQCM